MNRFRFALLAVALVVGLLTTASFAADETGKTPLRIDVKGQGGAAGSGTFTLLGASTAYSDAGTVTYQFSFGAITKSRAGQSFTPNSGTSTLKGRHGRIVIRTSGRGFDSGEGYEAWTGTWSIVKGTGNYAGLKGSGGYAAVITPGKISDRPDFSFRYEGFVTGS